MRNWPGSPDIAIRVGLNGNMGGNAGVPLVPFGMRGFMFCVGNSYLVYRAGCDWVAPRMKKTAP